MTKIVLCKKKSKYKDHPWIAKGTQNVCKTHTLQRIHKTEN